MNGHDTNRDAPVGDDSAAERVFAHHRNLLFSIAYRILGTATDAEDVVQDAWLRWNSADRSQVAEPKAYLARTVTNLAVDQLRSAQRRREAYVGPWLPEPILTCPTPGGPDASTAVETADSVSMAMLVVLEKLSPVERAVFVLHEVFDFSYPEIAEALDRSEPAVRQAGYRARSHVHARRPATRTDPDRVAEATERFLAASAGGDINALMQLLAPDVTLWTDGGGKVRQAMRPILGRDKVAAWLSGVARRPYEGVEIAAMSVVTAQLNGAPGIVISGAGRPIATLTVELDADGLIATIHNVANPDKLRAVASGLSYELPR